MLDWLRKIPSDSALEGVNGQYRSSTLLKYLSLIVLGAVACHSLVLFILSNSSYFPLLLAFDLPVSTFFLIVLLFHGRGNEKLWSWAATTGLWFLFTVGFLYTGGTRSGIFVGGYMDVILMAGILLGFRGALVFGMVSILAGLGMVIGGQLGWVNPPSAFLSPYIVWITQSIVIGGTVGLVRLLNSSIRSRYVRAEIELDERRRAQGELDRVERRFRALIENSTDIIALVDGLGEILYLSPAVRRTLGYDCDELIGQSSFKYIHPDDVLHVQSSLTRLLLHPKGIQHAEMRMLHFNGTWRWIEVSASNYLFDPDVRGIILNYRDITERKRQEEQSLHDAIHDELSGLYNRLLFVDRIENAVRRALRSDGHSFAVLVLDIDHFKNINDGLGYAAGDHLLREVARRLQLSVRASDTVARLGGDEFGILLDTPDGVQGAELLAQRIRQDLVGTPVVIGERELIVSCSIGVVIFSQGYKGPEEILRDAEIAMYRAKATGRNQHIFFNDRMREKVLERVGLEAELRTGLEKGEFIVYYQPIYALQSGRLVGFEALVRWQHPTRGLLLPGNFIEVAEESGLIVAMDFWVMGEASRTIRAWQRQYPQAAHLVANVNLSRLDLIQPNLLERVRAVLAETGLEPGRLKLEITEDLIMENNELAMETLRQLDKLGVSPEIDDFGRGHSSLEVLTTLSFVHTLKIGQNFVMAMNLGMDNFEVIRTIIALGHSLNKEVIAEGIETKEQLDILRGLGCEYGQGFYYSKGVCPAEAEKLILKDAPEAG